MTTTVTIKHQGPDHHDILIRSFNPQDQADTSLHYTLKIGEEASLHVYGTQALIIEEVEKK